MTNTKLLQNLINSKGLKYKYLAEKMDISYNCLYRKITNRSFFTSYEIQTLCNLLEINDLKLKNQIFFVEG